jgi:hypothetical protein
MAEIYRDLLIIICLGLLGWGLIRVERIYQYPFFMGSIFISFLVPQTFALMNNPGPVSQEALERVLLVSCFCAAACWLGYGLKPNKKWLAKLYIVVDERKLFRAGIALVIIGYLFNFLLANTTIQKASNGNWTGPATIYFFLAQVVNIALAIFLLQYLRRPSAINLICTVIAVFPLLQRILVGRRQPTMTLAIIIGLSFWLVRRYIPPRWLVITAIVTMTFLIPLVGALRGHFWTFLFSGNWQEVLSSSFQSFASLQTGTKTLELRNAALLMDAAERTGIYGYGTGFWDSIVFQYVPGQIVGYEFKQSLQFKLLSFDLLGQFYGYTIPNGSTITGVGDSFLDFSYLGFLVFALIGYIFKNLWISSFYHESTVSRLLYMGLVSPAMLGVTHGIGRFLQEAIFQVFFISLVTYYSRARYKFSYIDSPNPGE